MTTPTARVLPEQIQRQADEMAAFDAGVAADQAAAAALPAADTPVPPVAESPEPASPVAPVEPTPPAPQPDPWEQRYRSLQGMFERQLTDLRSELAAANAKLVERTAPPTPATPAPAPASRITAQDTEAFGADLLDVIGRKAEEIATGMLAPLQAKLAEAEAKLAEASGQVAGVAERQMETTSATYIQGLATAVPTWEAQNVDPGFLAWLAEIDPLTGVPRQTYMNDATASFDVKRTISLFTTWPGYAASAAAPQTASPPPSPPPVPSLTPASSRSDTPPAPAAAETAIWSLKDITAFYDDCGRGKYRADPAEQKRIETEIDAAVASNRVKP